MVGEGEEVLEAVEGEGEEGMCKEELEVVNVREEEGMRLVMTDGDEVLEVTVLLLLVESLHKGGYIRSVSSGSPLPLQFPLPPQFPLPLQSTVVFVPAVILWMQSRWKRRRRR